MERTGAVDFALRELAADGREVYIMYAMHQLGTGAPGSGPEYNALRMLRMPDGDMPARGVGVPPSYEVGATADADHLDRALAVRGREAERDAAGQDARTRVFTEPGVEQLATEAATAAGLSNYGLGRPELVTRPPGGAARANVTPAAFAANTVRGLLQRAQGALPLRQAAHGLPAAFLVSVSTTHPELMRRCGVYANAACTDDTEWLDRKTHALPAAMLIASMYASYAGRRADTDVATAAGFALIAGGVVLCLDGSYRGTGCPTYAVAMYDVVA